eukprot:gene13300-42890_t
MPQGQIDRLRAFGNTLSQHRATKGLKLQRFADAPDQAQWRRVELVRRAVRMLASAGVAAVGNRRVNDDTSKGEAFGDCLSALA